MILLLRSSSETASEVKSLKVKAFCSLLITQKDRRSQFISISQQGCSRKKGITRLQVRLKD
jgi:hypothetical protein